MAVKREVASCAQCREPVRLEALRWALIAGDTLLYFHGACCLLAWLKAKVAERGGIEKRAGNG